MPVPFRDLAEQEDLGLAAYVKLVDEPNTRGIRAALFCITARGEPVDFTFTRIDLPSAVLWRAGEQRRQAVAALCKALFTAAARTPGLLLMLADEVPARVLIEHLEVRIPACRVARGSPQPPVAQEVHESLGDTLHLYWIG